MTLGNALTIEAKRLEHANARIQVQRFLFAGLGAGGY